MFCLLKSEKLKCNKYIYIYYGHVDIIYLLLYNIYMKRMFMALAALGVFGASEARAQDTASTRDAKGISGISFEEPLTLFPSQGNTPFRDEYQIPFPLDFRPEPRRMFPSIRLPEPSFERPFEFAPGRRLSLKTGLIETSSGRDAVGVSVRIRM